MKSEESAKRHPSRMWSGHQTRRQGTCKVVENLSTNNGNSSVQIFFTQTQSRQRAKCMHNNYDSDTVRNYVPWNYPVMFFTYKHAQVVSHLYRQLR